MARDLCGGAAAAPKRTAAVVDDSFIVAGAAWAGLTAALGRNIIFVADHVAKIPNGEDERNHPQAVEDIRERQGEVAVFFLCGCSCSIRRGECEFSRPVGAKLV